MPISEFADAVTRWVLGVDDIVASIDVASTRGLYLRDALPVFGAGDREAWRAELDATLAVEEWSTMNSIDPVRDALAQLPDIERPLRLLDAGAALDEGALFELKRFAFWGAKVLDQGLPFLDPAGEWVLFLRTQMQTIHPERRPTPRFHLSSDLDPELRARRNERDAVRKKERALRRRLEGEVVEEIGGGFDVRGRYKPPSPAVEPEHPLLRRGTDGWTLRHDELDELAAALVERDEACDAAAERTMATLSDGLRATSQSWEEVASALALLDLRLAKVMLREAWRGAWPEWASEGATEVTDGRLPRLLDTLGDEVQPVSLRMEDATVVTGPNMGGKSALLELLGAVVWCGHHALPVPAHAARIRPVEGIVYVGAEEPRATQSGLSAFGREIRRVVEAWEKDAPRLWLLDELGRGTHPEEGASIAGHIIASRRARGDFVLATTHFPEVAAITDVIHLRIAGLDPDRAREALAAAGPDDEIDAPLRAAMDYRPLKVAADAADVPRDAWIVARLLGLPDN